MTARLAPAGVMLLSLCLAGNADAQVRRTDGKTRRTVTRHASNPVFGNQPYDQPVFGEPVYDAPVVGGPGYGAGHPIPQPCDLPPRVWVPARYEIVERQIIIPAEYRTVYEKVWVEPVYEWRQRPVFRQRHRHRHLHVNIGRVSLELGLGKQGHRGHHRTVRERVCVQPGHYTTVERTVLVRPERFEVVRERVLVKAGYWKNGY